MIATGWRACAWVVDDDVHESKQREARWVLEVHGVDGEVRQRLGICDPCAKAHFRQMRYDIPMVGDSYPVLRRMLPSDAILTFDDLTEGDGDDA